MKKWIERVSLLLTLVLSLGAAGTMYFRIANTKGTNLIFDKISWGIFAVVLLFSLGIAVLVILGWMNLTRFRPLDRLLGDRRLYWGLLILLGLVFLESIQDLLYLSAGLKEIYYPVLLRENRFLLVWAALISGQSLISWLLLGWQAGILKLSSLREIPRWPVIGFLVGLGVLILGSRGNLPANAPLPMLHILIVLLLVLSVWVGARYLQKLNPNIIGILRNDLIPLIFLWAIAFFLWSKVPLQPNYFIGAPRPPNNEFAPTSDAIYYEIQAQRLLAGEGFEEKVQHSFYNYLVSGFHLLEGDHYQDVYWLQIVLIAFTPFLMYKLASLLHSHFSGWLLAILFIIREFNALQLGDSITVSNVQEFMTEPIALLGVILFLYLSILWMKNRAENWGLPFLIGGVIGLIALIRVELLSLAIGFGLITLLTYRKQSRRWVFPGLLLLLGLTLTLTPWAFRNYQKTGVLTIDKGAVFERSVQYYLGQKSSSNEGEAVSPYQAFQEKLQTGYKRISLIWDRSTTSLQQTLIYLPSNHFPFGSVDTFVKIMPQKGRVFFFQDGLFSDVYLTHYIKSLPYWQSNWEGVLAPRSYLPQLLVLALISQGVYLSWKRHHWIGLLPLLTMIIHILIYAAVVHVSGGRYIQVVDWITLFYFCIGLSAGAAWLVRKLTGAELLTKDPINTTEDGFLPQGDEILAKWQGLGWGLLVFLVVLSMPIAESIIPRRFSDNYLDNRIQQLSSEDQTATLVDLDENEELLIGKALYPGFYSADEIFVDDRQGRMPEPGQAQMVFYLVGTRNLWISLPIDAPIDPFHHGAEVILLGKILRDSEEDLAKRMWPFFEANNVILLPDLLDSP